MALSGMGPVAVGTKASATEKHMSADAHVQAEHTLSEQAKMWPKMYEATYLKSKGMSDIQCGTCACWLPTFDCGTSLYAFTIILEIVAVVFGVLHALKLIHNKKPPTNEVIVMQILLCVSFSIKIPYLRDKVLALITLGVLICGYGAISVLLLVCASRFGTF